MDEYSESNEVEMAKRTVFNLDISSKLGDSIKLPSSAPPEFFEQDWNAEPYDDDEAEKPLEPFEADLVDAAGRPLLMHSLNDVLINAEVLLDHGDSAALARVICQAVDSDGKSLVRGTQILYSTHRCMSVNSMMELSRSMLPMLLPPAFMRKVMLMDSLLRCYIRLLIISLQGRQSS